MKKQRVISYCKKYVEHDLVFHDLQFFIVGKIGSYFTVKYDAIYNLKFPVEITNFNRHVAAKYLAIATRKRDYKFKNEICIYDKIFIFALHLAFP